MKKLFIGLEGKFYGMAKKVEKTGNDLMVTMPGDFLGMTERTVVFKSGKILHEDDGRIYIGYK